MLVAVPPLLAAAPLPLLVAELVLVDVRLLLEAIVLPLFLETAAPPFIADALLVPLAVFVVRGGLGRRDGGGRGVARGDRVAVVLGDRDAASCWRSGCCRQSSSLCLWLSWSWCCSR